MSATLTNLSHDDLFNILDFIYPFFSEYVKAVGGKQFEAQHKREYLAKIIFGIMKGNNERKDWILDFRGKHSKIMGIKLVSNLNYNEYFYKSLDDSNIYVPALYLRKFYEDLVKEVKNWLLIAKNGLFYEILMQSHIPIVQLFWESLFHIIRDTPIIMGSMKFKQYYNLELPMIQDYILDNIIVHVMKAVEEPVWLFETFLVNEISSKDAHSLGFKSYLRHYQLEEGEKHELYQDVFVEKKDWTSLATDNHWKGFLKFLSDCFNRYPTILSDSKFVDIINSQFEKDLGRISKFTTELAKFLYLDRNIPINPIISNKLFTLLSFTPVFKQILEKKLNEFKDNDKERNLFLEHLFLRDSLLSSSILNLQFEIIDMHLDYMDECLDSKVIDLHFSKCPVVTYFIEGALMMEDLSDPLKSSMIVIVYIEKFRKLFERFNRKIFGYSIYRNIITLFSNFTRSGLTEDSYEWQQRFIIFTELFQNLVSNKIDELPETDLSFIFRYTSNEKIITFLFEQPPQFHQMLARYIPDRINESLLKIIEKYVGNNNSYYQRNQIAISNDENKLNTATTSTLRL